MPQTSTVDCSRARLEDFLRAEGFWGTDALRERHAYVLSPSVYVISASQQTELERLASSTYAAVEVLGKRLHEAAHSTANRHEDSKFLRLAKSATRGLGKPGECGPRVPPVIKLDLVQDHHGHYKIAEVDAYNPRGLGFMALLEESIPSSLKPSRYPGVGGLQTLLAKHANGGGNAWNIIVSEQERYYQPTFHVLARSLAKRGTEVTVIRESEVAAGGTMLREHANVFTIPDSLKQNIWLRDHLLARYREGSLTALYPPRAYLGSKAFLPFLRTCPGMEEFIPDTILVGKGHDCRSFAGHSVLKAAVSSGLKAVYFSDLDGSFPSRLEEARKEKHPSWILQEQVPQAPVPVAVYDRDGQTVVSDYYLRVTMMVTADGVMDVEVTGRPDRKVHGAKDCIMIPTVRA